MLSIEACANVRLARSVTLGRLIMDATSTIDLNGFELRAMGAKTNSVSIPVGRHMAAEFASGIFDSSDPDSGILFIANTGALIIIR